MRTGKRPCSIAGSELDMPRCELQGSRSQSGSRVRLGGPAAWISGFVEEVQDERLGLGMLDDMTGVRGVVFCR